MTRGALIVALMLACSSGNNSPEPTTRSNTEPTTHNDAEPKPMPEPSDDTSWKRHEIPQLELSFEVLDGVAVSAGVAGGTLFAMQTHGPVKLGLWSGPNQNLARWRQRFGPPRKAAFGDEESIQVCGRSATRQVARVEQGPTATGAFPSDDGIGHEEQKAPAVTSIGVAFRNADKDILLSWTVETDKRDQFAAAEQRFFASVECK